MKLGVAIADLSAAESRLAARLRDVGERHRAEHDVYLMTRTLAGWSERHEHALEPFASKYGAPAGRSERAGAEPPRSEGGLALLDDLRSIYVAVAEASIDWTALAQGAQAARDQDLLAVVTECHAETLRQLKWATTRIKEAAPQALTSSA